MTHSTHFIYGYMVLDWIKGRKDVLFNDSLNTFYLMLNGVGLDQRKERYFLFKDSLNTFYLYLKYGIGWYQRKEGCFIL